MFRDLPCAILCFAQKPLRSRTYLPNKCKQNLGD